MWEAFANTQMRMQSYSHFFSKNISIYAIFNDQSFNDTLTNSIVSFEQLNPDFLSISWKLLLVDFASLGFGNFQDWR